MSDIIMCCDTINSNQPNDSFKLEYQAASKFGKVHLFDFYDLEKGNLDKVLPHLSGNGETIYYQGWMLTEPQYHTFYQLVLDRGHKLINDPQQYLNCHHFKNWYPVIEEYTPPSIIVNSDELRTLTIETVKFMDQVNSSVIIKDYVSSLKHMWHEACFIPQGSNIVQVAKVLASFLETKRMYNDFIGGLVVRKFIPLRQIGTYSKSNLPISQEFRAFVHNGKVISHAPYWNEGSYTKEIPDDKLVNEIANIVYQQLGSNLFTVDMACCEDGTWTCIEVGDGQVSGLPDFADKKDYYKKLLK